MLSVRAWAALSLTLLAACGSGETPEAPETPETPAAPEQPANPETPALDAGQLASGADNIALVPSPVETQKALEAAGIEAKLADFVVSRELSTSSKDEDNTAVRTGVVLADMLLTVKRSEKDKLLADLERLKLGMEQLGGGADIATLLTDYRERVKGDAVTRDELLRELDELSGAVIPELEFNGRNRIVPLIQAGSWLEGANLVAKAVKQSGNPAAADSLLKQPAVVDFFLKYVRTEGSEKAPAAVTEKLEAALVTLKGLAEKSEPLTMEDIDKVIQTTDDVLALL